MEIHFEPHQVQKQYIILWLVLFYEYEDEIKVRPFVIKEQLAYMRNLSIETQIA